MHKSSIKDQARHTESVVHRLFKLGYTSQEYNTYEAYTKYTEVAGGKVIAHVLPLDITFILS